MRPSLSRPGFSHDSNLTSTNVRPSVCLSVSLWSICKIHDSHPWKSSKKVIHENHPWKSSMKIIHENYPWKSSMWVIQECHPWKSSIKYWRVNRPFVSYNKILCNSSWKHISLLNISSSIFLYSTLDCQTFFLAYTSNQQDRRSGNLDIWIVNDWAAPHLQIKLNRCKQIYQI